MMKESKIRVKKRNGNMEPIDIEKLHKVVFYACENISGVSPSEVEIKSQIQFYDGITSREIQETIIKAAADLITEETPNYQYVGGRLINYLLRKEVYGQFQPWHIKDIVRTNVDRGFYDPELASTYSDEEWDMIESFIKHERDESLTYVAMEQLRGKYLVQNRAQKIIYETPQVCYILIAATLFSGYPKRTRMQYVKAYYDAISQHYISLPTPVMAGVRTPQRQFSSCVLIESGDSLNSINATSSAIVKYVSQKAGIGINVGRIRAIGSPIRKGDAYHTGMIPFVKLFQASVKSCSQGSVRGGAATAFYPLWHFEVEDLLVLKNNRGTEDNRVRHMDYGVQFNKLMYERLIESKDITLFSPNDVPGLYDAFFADQDEFRRLYEEAEQNPLIRKKSIPAIELFSSFVEERKTTGRIYLQNVDNVNLQGPFLPDVASVRQSNLCMEVVLPCKPLNDISDPEGEISLCTLSAINWGNIKSPKDFEKYCDLAIRGLDELLDYQNYPVLAAEFSTMKRRPLGVGIINFAYWLAKNDLTYQHIDEDGLALIDEWTEAWAYYLTKASVDLAEEKGPCPGYMETRYGLGMTPNQLRRKDVDELVPYVERMEWDALRNRMLKVGIRNSTLMALMPAESSAQCANATNGIEPPRGLISIKQSKDGVLRQVVPEIRKLKNKYDLLWDQKSPEGYLKIVSVLQKYIDQGISVNTSYNPKNYEDEKIPLSVMLRDIVMFYKMGGKQLYYFNTNDGQGEIDIEKYVESDPVEQEECESCVL